MYSDIVGGGLTVLNKAGDLLRRGGGSDGLIDFTSVGRVEPLVLIENPALRLDCIGEVQQSLLAIFSGYYLQAASLSNVMGNIRVIDRLDSLNPNRNPVNTGLNTWMIASEAYETGLPFPGNTKLQMAIESIGLGSLGGASKGNAGISTGEGKSGSGGSSKGNTAGAFGGMGATAAKKAPGMSTGEGKSGSGGGSSKGSTKGAMGGMGVADKGDPNDLTEGTQGRQGSGGGSYNGVMSKSDIHKTMVELTNLSVGKAYEINISDGQKSLPVMVNIRLIASAMDTDSLVHILATGSDDNSFKERWHGWKSGRLAFWKDLVLCNDLIEKRRKDLLKDRTGALTNIARTDLGNTLSSVVSGTPTIASSTNIAVITQDTAERLELELEGKLAKFDIRQRMFKKTSLMILAVIDEVDHNEVVFYHRGISMPTRVRIKDLKASSKGTGPDISEILKAFMGGRPPSL